MLRSIVGTSIGLILRDQSPPKKAQQRYFEWSKVVQCGVPHGSVTSPFEGPRGPQRAVWEQDPRARDTHVRNSVAIEPRESARVLFKFHRATEDRLPLARSVLRDGQWKGSA